MGKPLFNSPTFGRGKLVRDGVPEEIHRRGGTEPVDELPEAEVDAALLAKLQEEAWEVAQTDAASIERVEELADLLEVMEEIVRRSGLSMQMVRDSRILRAQRRGQFHRGYFLREEFIPRKARG